MALEEKDNVVLRAMKASCGGVDLTGIKRTSNFPSINKLSPKDQTEPSAEHVPNSNLSCDVTSNSSPYRKTGTYDFPEDLGGNFKKTTDIIDIDQERSFSSLNDKKSSANSFSVTEPRTNANLNEDINLRKSCFSRMIPASDTTTGDLMHEQSNRAGFPGSNIATGNSISKISVASMDKDEIQTGQKSSSPEIVILDKITEDPVLPHIQKEASCVVPTSTLGKTFEFKFVKISVLLGVIT